MKKVVWLVVALIFSFSMTVAAVEKAEGPDTSEPVKVAAADIPLIFSFAIILKV